MSCQSPLVTSFWEQNWKLLLSSCMDLYILVTADVTELNKQLVLISRHMCCPFYFTLCWPLEWLVFHKSSLLLMCFYSAFSEKESTLIVHSDCIWWMNCLLMWYALHNKRSNIGCLVNDPNVLNNAVPLFQMRITRWSFSYSLGHQ